MRAAFRLALYATLVTAAPTTTPPARDKDAGVCTEDADCVKFPGTVCVTFTSGDYTAGKCTPNYGQKPVCRGGQAGLCPQYQDPTQGYMNTQCVLIDRAQQPATDTDALIPVNAQTAAPAASATSTTGGGAAATTTTTTDATATTTTTDSSAAAAATPTTTKKAAAAAAPKTTAAAASGPQPPKVPDARRLKDAPTTTPGAKAGAATTPTTTTAAKASTPETTEAATTTAAAAAGTATTTTTTDTTTVDSSSAGSATGSDSTAAAGTSTAALAEDATVPVKAQLCPSDPSLPLDSPKCWFNTVYANRTITVQYKCVDYSMCLEQSAASQAPQKEKEAYCRPKKCVSGTNQLCNNRGTCQSNDPFQPMTSEGYACRCYAGYTGQKCETTTGSTCDVDCGVGGACINRKCVCYAAYQGKDVRCSKCVKDSACENGNKCNLDTGTCQCAPGFIGLTCGGKLNNCAGVTCNNGGQPYDSGKVCQCKCAQCRGTVCPLCGGPDNKDCSSTTGGCPVPLLANHGCSISSYGAATMFLGLLALAL